tara:strand:- start:1567 stop:1776 length:210 start_codon:yes stop_codon:yes gene_type:complete
MKIHTDIVGAIYYKDSDTRFWFGGVKKHDGFVACSDIVKDTSKILLKQRLRTMVQIYLVEQKEERMQNG